MWNYGISIWLLHLGDNQTASDRMADGKSRDLTEVESYMLFFLVAAL